MKKLFSLLSFLLVIGAPASAQWVTQAAGYSQQNLLTFGLKVVNENVVWGVALDTAFTQPVRNFTRTTNGGTTWTTGQVGGILASGQQVVGVTAIDANTAWVTTFNMITFGGSRVYRTTNGGGSWTHQSTASFSSPDGFATGIHFFNANEGVVVGNINNGYFEIYTTTNGGTNWTRVPSASIPAPVSTFEGASLGIAYSGNSVWFGTEEGRVFRSTNKGLTWTASPTGLFYIDGLAFRDTQNGLAKSGQDIARTTDGGQTWTQVAANGPVFSEGFTYVPGTAGTYVSTGGAFDTSTPGSSFSPDNGDNWYFMDNSIHHGPVGFASPTVGYSGGYNQSATVGGIHKWNGPLVCNPLVSGLASAYCQNSAPVQLSATPTTGTFSGPGINGTTFSPAQAGLGSHTITYTVPSGPCQGTVSFTVTVNAPVPVSFTGLSSPYSTSSPSVPLTGSPAGGTFSGPGTSGNSFSPAQAGGGVHTIVYTLVQNGCTMSSSQNVTVFGPPAYCTSNLYTVGCSDNDRIDLFTFHTINNPTNNCLPNGYSDFTNLSATVNRGQSYNLSVQSHPAYEQGFGVWIDYNQDGDFDDAGEFVWNSGSFGTQLFTGSVLIPTTALLGPTRLRVRAMYEYVPSAGEACTLFTFGEAEDYTVVINSTSPVTDAGVVGIANPASGCGLGTAEQVCILVKNMGNTSLSNIPVSYTLNGGAPVTAVVPGPIAAFGFAQYCFTQTVNLGTPGTYTLVGTAQIAGDANTSNNSFSQTVTHYTAVQASITGLASGYCSTSNPVSLSGSPSGGTFSGPGVSGGVFYPSQVQPGTHTISYTVTLPGCPASTATQQVTVDPAPMVYFTGFNSNFLCTTDAPVTLSPFPAGGQFLATPGLAGNTFSPAVAGPGMYDITYVYTNASGCTGSYTETVFINSGPAANFSYTNNGSTYSFSYPEPGHSYQWNFGNGNTSQLQNPVYTYPSGGTFTVTLTVTTQSGCTSTSTQNIVILGSSDLLKDQIRLYPNPTSGLLTIEAPANTAQNAEVITLQGQVVKRQALNGEQQVRLDLNGLAEGAYMVRIYSNAGVLTRPVLLQK